MFSRYSCSSGAEAANINYIGNQDATSPKTKQMLREGILRNASLYGKGVVKHWDALNLVATVCWYTNGNVLGHYRIG